MSVDIDISVVDAIRGREFMPKVVMLQELLPTNSIWSYSPPLSFT